ncbi:MAG: tetratricopeptide repeat protein [Bacteroidota bacterium]
MENQDLIEKYLRGELDDAKAQQFRQQLTKDEALAKAFAVEKEIHNAIQLNVEANFRSRLEKLSTQPSQSVTTTIPMYRRAWFLAASLLFLIGLFWWSFNQFGTSDTQDLFAQYYETPTFSFDRSGTATPTDFDKVVETYQQKDYSQVIEKLSTTDSQKLNPKWILLLGICYLETAQFEKAVVTFDVLQAKGSLLDDAVWYKGLTYLKMGQKEMAKTTLQTLLSGEFLVTPKRKERVKAVLHSI